MQYFWKFFELLGRSVNFSEDLIFFFEISRTLMKFIEHLRSSNSTNFSAILHTIQKIRKLLINNVIFLKVLWISWKFYEQFEIVWIFCKFSEFLGCFANLSEVSGTFSEVLRTSRKFYKLLRSSKTSKKLLAMSFVWIFVSASRSSMNK